MFLNKHTCLPQYFRLALSTSLNLCKICRMLSHSPVFSRHRVQENKSWPGENTHVALRSSSSCIREQNSSLPIIVRRKLCTTPVSTAQEQLRKVLPITAVQVHLHSSIEALYESKCQKRVAKAKRRSRAECHTVIQGSSPNSQMHSTHACSSA